MSRRYDMPMIRKLLTGLFGIGAVAAAQPAFSQDSGTQPGATQPPARSGMTVYVDPQTGALRGTPAPGTVPLEVTPELRTRMSTSNQGLTETPSTVPGGGMRLDLQGRFQSPMIATVDPNGKVRIHHLGEPADTAK
jgi:hypothetical protein